MQRAFTPQKAGPQQRFLNSPVLDAAVAAALPIAGCCIIALQQLLLLLLLLCSLLAAARLPHNSCCCRRFKRICFTLPLLRRRRLQLPLHSCK
jgi:hypothetical protein